MPFPDEEPQIHERLDSAAVTALTAKADTPVTFSEISSDRLRHSSPLNSLPMNLSLEPSIISTNEGGTGLGYSKMKVRGVSGSQTLVTLNGITLNDAESQEVFWVNIPGLSGILSSVQLQRGLGTASGGAGAFGASINMATATPKSGPEARVEMSAGSFGTAQTSLRAGSGLLRSGLYFDAALSLNHTDGYIRNAFADVSSIFAQAGWIGSRNTLKLLFLRGEQHSGITWEGIPESIYLKDRTYNPAGRYIGSDGKEQFYDNESDNYIQSHWQLNWKFNISSSLHLNSTFDITKGDGFYEQYKCGQDEALYGLGSSVTDLVSRKEMDNVAHTLSSQLGWHRESLELDAGIYLSSYLGGHFGDVIWSSRAGSLKASDNVWYRNDAIKREADAFVKAEWFLPGEWLLYAKVEARQIIHRIEGTDDDGRALDYYQPHSFINPGIGASKHIGEHNKVYFSAIASHREPGRSDIKENASIKPEKMLDIEGGWSYSSPRLSLAADFYLMEYKDMLLETGRINDVGYTIKENVPRSYRRGAELSGAVKAGNALSFKGNVALSANKIKDYTCFVDLYEPDWTPAGQRQEHYALTDMLLSPSLTGMIRAEWSKDGWLAALSWKYVGKQYWDNTSCPDRMIPAYSVSDCSVSKSFDIRGWNLEAGVYAGNIFNNQYYADAWVWRAEFTDGSTYREEGLFPQAPRNIMFKLTIGF